MHLCLVALVFSGSIALSRAWNATNSTLSVSSTTPKSTVKSTSGFEDFPASGIGLATTTNGKDRSSTKLRDTTRRTLSSTISSLGSKNIQLSTLNGTSSNRNETRGSAPSSNSSVGLDQCWDQWKSYWDELPTSITTTASTCAPTFSIATYVTTIAFTRTASDVSPTTSTSIATYTSVIDNNGFATSTYFRTETYLITNTRSAKGSTYAYTASQATTWTVTCDWQQSSPGPPNCTLPSTAFPQCEQAWDSWVSAQLTTTSVKGATTSSKPLGSAPSCTQASIAEESCVALRDAFVSSSLALSYFSKILPSNITTDGPRGHEMHWSGGYYSYSMEEGWKWPPSTAFFAPSCTLGCGRCSIEGGTVDLLYWPPATSMAIDTNDSAPTTTTNPLVITTLGTALTSPTLYVSYHSLYAKNACGEKIGTTIYDTIIAIPTDSTLSSIWGRIGGRKASESTDVHTSTAVFNVADLYHDPVPMSIYSSQPWCAKWAYFNLWEDFNSTWWTCPHTRPYKPIIKVPEDILRGIDPLWRECGEAYGGVYDPPLALTPAETAAGVTLPGVGEVTSTSAVQGPTALPVTVPSTTAKTTAGSVPTGSFTPYDPDPISEDSSNDLSSGSSDNLLDNEGQGEDSANNDPEFEAPDNGPANDNTLNDSPNGQDTGILEEAIQSAAAAAQAGQSQHDPGSSSDDEVQIAIGSRTFTRIQADAAETIFVDAETSFPIPTAGSVVTVGSQVISAGESGELVVGAGGNVVTVALNQAAETTRPSAALIVGSRTFNLESGRGNVFANADTTFTLDRGAASQLGSFVVSVDRSVNAVVVDIGEYMTTVALPDPGGAVDESSTGSKAVTFDIDGEAYTAIIGPGSDQTFTIVRDGTTLAIDGAAATIRGHAVTLASDRVVVDETGNAWTSSGTQSSIGDVSATSSLSTSDADASASTPDTVALEGTGPPSSTPTSGARPRTRTALALVVGVCVWLIVLL